MNSCPDANRSRDPHFKIRLRVPMLAVLSLVLAFALPSLAGAEGPQEEYKRQLNEATKKYPLVVAALMHAQEDAVRMAELAHSLDSEALAGSMVFHQMCLWTCNFTSAGQVCGGCPEPATAQRPCLPCTSVCQFQSVLGTQVDCADCMVARGDNGCL